MTQGLEVDAAHQWVHGVLNGDSLLRSYLGNPSDGIFEAQIPRMPYEVKFPLIIHSDQANRDTITTESVRILTHSFILVKAMDRGDSYASLRPIVSRADVLLHRSSGTVTDGLIYHCRRESTIRYAETEGDNHYRHLGGLYHIWVGQT